MKQWLWFPVLLAAACLLSRLPHPAVDVGELEPVGIVLVAFSDGAYHLRTDTGAHGTGASVTEAAESMTKAAPERVFLETAEYVLLTPDVPVAEELYRIFRPACRVCLTDGNVDLQQALDYLKAHPPETTLTHLRAGGGELQWLHLQ